MSQDLEYNTMIAWGVKAYPEVLPSERVFQSYNDIYGEMCRTYKFPKYIVGPYRPKSRDGSADICDLLRWMTGKIKDSQDYRQAYSGSFEYLHLGDNSELSPEISKEIEGYVNDINTIGKRRPR